MPLQDVSSAHQRQQEISSILMDQDLEGEEEAELRMERGILLATTLNRIHDALADFWRVLELYPDHR